MGTFYSVLGIAVCQKIGWTQAPLFTPEYSIRLAPTEFQQSFHQFESHITSQFNSKLLISSFYELISINVGLQQCMTFGWGGNLSKLRNETLLKISSSLLKNELEVMEEEYQFSNNLIFQSMFVTKSRIDL